MKTSELKGTALDWAVATCEGYSNLRLNPHHFAEKGELIMTPPRVEHGPVLLGDLCFHSDWLQGGPIIEREKIGTRWSGFYREWAATHPDRLASCVLGGTQLIAAMRCYVMFKLGEEVEVPDGVR